MVELLVPMDMEAMGVNMSGYGNAEWGGFGGGGQRNAVMSPVYSGSSYGYSSDAGYGSAAAGYGSYGSSYADAYSGYPDNTWRAGSVDGYSGSGGSGSGGGGSGGSGGGSVGSNYGGGMGNSGATGDGTGNGGGYGVNYGASSRLSREEGIQTLALSHILPRLITVASSFLRKLRKEDHSDTSSSVPSSIPWSQPAALTHSVLFEEASFMSSVFFAASG
ncbi:hypothetical protein SELMODRAFT_416164 [Selaginella moellendorffii]|uniref:Uncharacterized protein n=1 Tax=Selaginella moellendorffii TaxID=88036 RepID=D8RYA4_SELML|nr:hypothetical protein SELMODRAFT_416164 [Selaginella moellendorffii]